MKQFVIAAAMAAVAVPAHAQFGALDKGLKRAKQVQDLTISESEEQQIGADAQMAARRDHDVRDRLARITCPTLVASGSYDGIAPPTNGAVIAASIPGAEQRCYEGGHLFVLQDPQALPDITDFFECESPTTWVSAPSI